MKSKKAAIEVAFNWIFVLIAGGVILLFFISLINTQREKSEANIALTVKTELKSILTGAMLSKARQLDIDIPKTIIKFKCDFATCEDFLSSTNPACYSQYGIGDTGINEQTPSQIIFAPFEISGRKLLLWTRSWNLPFSTTNFLYVTGTNIKYIFVNDGPQATDLYNEFPEKTNKHLISDNALGYEGSESNRNFKFIFTTLDPENSIVSQEIRSAAHYSNINAIKVDPSTKQLSFYKFLGDSFTLTDSVSYITNTEAYAAIFSDSIDFYKCNMQKAFNRFHLITKILKERSDLLYDDLNTPTRCIGTYDTINNGLRELSESSIIFSSSNMLQINNVIPILKSANQDTKEKSCPLIY